MPIKLKRDQQRWLFNYVLQETGRVMQFEGQGRGSLPPSVHMHEMVSKHFGKIAARVALVASEEYAAGHRQTALDLYFDAAAWFGHAQHPIFENNEEKQFLHAASIEAYDKVRELAPYPIEHVAIPWERQHVYGNLHLLPDGERAPCVIYIPGCDMTKEMYPHPLTNHAHQRGMHILSLDGPGQGECNLDGVGLTDDNYERAVSAVIDYLVGRPEIDPDAIMILGLSFGSFWAIRSAVDPRLRAVAAPWVSICDKRYLMEEESPRYKMLFAYLTQAESEEQLDAITGRMTVHEQLGRITCPTLLTVGEFDSRSPLADVLELYTLMTCERELWVFEDQHHHNTVAGHIAGFGTMIWNMDAYMTSLDWLADRAAGRLPRHSGEVLYVRSGQGGPYGDTATADWSWFESLPRGVNP
jgi:hypothetical protein